MTTAPRNDEVSIAARRALYDETGRVATVFWEWRHKIILLFVAEITLALAATTWIYREKLGGIAMAIPLALAAPLLAACSVFDRRNVQILDDCFAVNALLERDFAVIAARATDVASRCRLSPSPREGPRDRSSTPEASTP